MSGIAKPLEMAHWIVKQNLSPGATVIDATLGNGHDALFLADLVGPEGLVYGFDVQAVAVEKSTEKMQQAGMRSFQFHCVGHEFMLETIPEELRGKIGAVMFNLGYLPSADKSVISLAQTTLQAIAAAQQLLQPKGVMTIMCYPGHDGGDDEAEAVTQYMSGLDRKDWRVVTYQFINAPNAPAFLIAAEKLREIV